MDKKGHNYFFEAYQINSETQEEKCLGMINVKLDSNFDLQLFKYAIQNIKSFTDEYLSIIQPNETLEDSIKLIYFIDIKNILHKLCPIILLKLACVVGEGMIEKDDVYVRLVTSYEYRQYDKEYDNQLKFIEYINSEKAYTDKNSYITKEILLLSGFELNEDEITIMKQFWNENPEQCKIDPNDYVSLRIWTNDERPLKLDIDNQLTNRGTMWHVHIDNEVCSTIGCADIDTVWEFNTLMEVFGSKFRL